MNTFSFEKINERLENLVGWKYENNCITKTFTFKNFSENFSFMTRIAMLAETYNHHPDWSGGYKNLIIRFSTHDASGVTELDFKLALEIEKLLK